MRVERITSAEFRNLLELDLPAGSEAPPAAGLARLIRRCVRRWGTTDEARVRTYLLHQLEAAGYPDPESAREAIRDTLDLLADIEDIARPSLNGRRQVAAARPRAVRIGDREVVLLGLIPEQAESELPPRDAHDPLRRFAWDDSKSAALLGAYGILPETLEDWLGTPDYHEHLRRRGASVRDLLQDRPLRLLWDKLQEELRVRGLNANSGGSYQILAGRPGGYFSNSEPSSGGRWQTPEIDGVWIARRRGYSDKHWHRGLLAIENGSPCRAIDFYSADEADWAVLARGVALGEEEVMRRDGELLASTFPPPRQLLRSLRLAGRHVGGTWQWRIPEDLPTQSLIFW